MVGEKLGSFRIEGVLGVGAMGVVYRATNETTGKPAAVKVVNGEIAQRGRTYERFKREAEILQQFRHPNIVRFLAVGRYQGTSYFAMEYIQGKTLEQVLADKGPMPWQEVVDLGIQLCDALHYAHEHGVVHRDLKPSNLMLSDAGRLKLTDFGIAKDLDATSLTATGRTLGTAAYMAPEQIRGTPEVSHKTDLYALGALFYQMLTGSAPFEGATAVVLMHCHLNEPAPRPSRKLSDVPRALDDLVFQLLAKMPQDRPWDAAAVGESLRKIQAKVQRGESLPAVWPTEGNGASPGVAEPSKRPAKKGGRSVTNAGAKGGPAGRGWPGVNRQALEIAGLLLALATVGAGIGYVVWPPSAAYLYREAERRMASDDRHDWQEARDRYLDPLDARFADNPYKETTQVWRDKILLDEAEGRARTLQSPLSVSLSKPQTKAEETFVAYYTLASAADKNLDDREAARVYDELADQFRGDQADRKWFLLAARRAADRREAVEQRRTIITKVFEQAAAEEKAGHGDRALAIKTEALERYGKYPDVREYLNLDSPPSPGTATPTP